MKCLWALALINASLTIAFGQAVDNIASFKMIDAPRYVRMHYENDWFSQADLYYTQGVNIEFVSPSLGNSFLSKVLVKPANSVSNFGISIEHNGYTPTSIRHHEILYGDRPFAADIFIKAFTFSSNAEKRLRTTSAFSLGGIGPLAGGYPMQRQIHKWINGTPPAGWENQIRNDLVLNYEMSAEKNLLRAGQVLYLNVQGAARIGTLSDKASMSLVLMAGRLNGAIRSVFGGEQGRVKPSAFTWHFYAQPVVSVVGYDATLQGGVFNRDSPYTISAEGVSRLTFQANGGLVLHWRKVNLEYFQSWITREFSTGNKPPLGWVEIWCGVVAGLILSSKFFSTHRFFCTWS